MHISYNLHKLENALAFQITDQSDSLTAYLRSVGKFVASNDWDIKIGYSPKIDMLTQTIYLGNYDKDLTLIPSVVVLGSNTTRDTVSAEVYKAIKELINEAIDDTAEIKSSSFVISEAFPIDYVNQTLYTEIITL